MRSRLRTVPQVIQYLSSSISHSLLPVLPRDNLATPKATQATLQDNLAIPKDSLDTLKASLDTLQDSLDTLKVSLDTLKVRKVKQRL